MDGISAPDGAPHVARGTQHFGTIIVVGGGCYGGYYVRQLARAHRAGALHWARLIVVDGDASCAVSTLPPDARPPALELVAADWRAFFAHYLAGAADQPDASAHDAIVPSPLMPHLMADWLMDRARARWPRRDVSIAPIGAGPPTPWQRTADDGTQYVSFAEWMCPINCVEPERCPHTRGPRDWSLPVTLHRYAAAEVAAHRPVGGPFLFRCLHRAYGVGMLDVRDVVEADRDVAQGAAGGPREFLVGTVSHCHGALRRIAIGG